MVFSVLVLVDFHWESPMYVLFRSLFLQGYGLQSSDNRLCPNLQDIEWLRSITNLPILIKGVLTREDGKIAASCSFQFLYLFKINQIGKFYYSGC